jgi:phosphoglycerol transferase MdoB-like AlkP superfamily enzyme
MIFTAPHIRLMKRFLFLLIPFTLLRIGFYLYNLNLYKQFTQQEIFESFLLGLRFDLAAICLINIPIILLALLPISNSKFLSFERYLFTSIITVAFLISLIDFELFLFMGKRMSLDLFSISGDIVDQLPQITLHYWYLPLLGCALSVLVYFTDKKLSSIKPLEESWFKRIMGGLLLMGLSFIAIRGGLQHKSINVQTAFVQGKNELGHLVLNTPYHFVRTLKNRRIQKLTFFKTDDEAKSVIVNTRDFRSSFDGKKSANIVLIILESFALEYLEQGYTPFLKELSEQGLFFQRHLANGRRSIESLPSLLCALPALIDDPISKSSFSGNNFECLPKILKGAGYSNVFFHAGARGTMGFEAYTLANGFDRYFSKEDYPDNKDFDGTWGIFDGPFMQFSARKISELKPPFLAGIFTLSSHQPYSIPLEFKSRFPKGSLDIHESIGYTDWALREFFRAAAKEAWFKDTVFILTADHSQKLDSKKYQNLVGYYRVPLVIVGEPLMGMKATAKITHHSDIPHTVLEIVGLNSDGLPMTGASVFSHDPGLALNYADGATYFLARDESILVLSKDGLQSEFSYDWETGQVGPHFPSERKELKAFMQYFINGLINNNLSIYR